MRWKLSETEPNADDNEKLLISARAHLLTYLAELAKDGLLFVVDQQGRAINETTFVKYFPRRLAEWDAARWMVLLGHKILSRNTLLATRKGTSHNQREPCARRHANENGTRK